MLYDIVIIGGGPCGYTAAMYAVRAGLSALVIEKAVVGGQMALTGEIENYPGVESTDGFTLAMKMQEIAQKFGAQTKYAAVCRLELAEKTKKVYTEKEVFTSKAVIIASGASPKTLGIDGESALTGAGVHYCAHCDGRFYKDKTVAVIGGGNSAVSDALYLSKLAKKVFLVHRRDTLRASKIYHSQLESAGNIELVFNNTPKSFIKNDGAISGILTENTVNKEQTELLCDGVFVSIGRKPETDFLDGILPLDENGYIIADETTKTSIPGVFAAGDVRTKTLRQIVTAAADGAVAVDSAEKYISENWG